jgi:hypothetical protein
MECHLPSKISRTVILIFNPVEVQSITAKH